jgi:hypothetical protein
MAYRRGRLDIDMGDKDGLPSCLIGAGKKKGGMTLTRKKIYMTCPHGPPYSWTRVTFPIFLFLIHFPFAHHERRLLYDFNPSRTFTTLGTATS